jgi:hypothetical protein
LTGSRLRLLNLLALALTYKHYAGLHARTQTFSRWRQVAGGIFFEIRVSNLQGALGGQTSWSRHFFDPIPTSDGGKLRTLRDAGVFVLALPPAEAKREHCKVAMECPISAAEKGGIVMMAHIAMLRALNHDNPDPAPAARYRIVR